MTLSHTDNIDKRAMKYLITLLTLIILLPSTVSAESRWSPSQPPSLIEKSLNITVYRSASCGCCKDWVSHLKKHDFKVEDVVSDDMNSVKKKLGLPAELASCHTGVIDGYIIEGHVPAQDIKQLINQKPDIAGLSVPQMPHGTPGMETGRSDDFYVVAFDKRGNMGAFNHYKKE